MDKDTQQGPQEAAEAIEPQKESRQPKELRPYGFQKGNRAQSSKRDNFITEVREFLGKGAPHDKENLNRLQRILVTLAKIASDENNKNAVKAAELLLDRAFGQASKAPEDYAAMRDASQGLSVQVVVVPQTGQSAINVMPSKPAMPSQRAWKQLKESFADKDEG